MRWKLLLLVVLVGFAPPAAGQTGTTLSGTITQGESLAPLSGALVVIDELRREVRADENGRYVFENVPPGDYHIGVRAEGYSTRRTEVTVGSTPATLNIAVDFRSEERRVGKECRSRWWA